MKKIFTVLILVFSLKTYAQQGIVSGIIKDKASQEVLAGVTVIIEGTSPPVGTSSGADGRFKLSAPTGSYNLTATFVGYKPATKYNIIVTSGNANVINFEMEEEQTSLKEIVVHGNRSAAASTVETPLSVQRLTTEEIKTNPGGNFDISRVIQALPGVGGSTGSASFRNDLIIRGGAPNENVYYLDGIEVPVINHFTTQGSAGGPQGILNVSFIEDVTLSTSAFDARYDNPLSAVLHFKQRDGNADRLQGNFRLSATELAATFDGPLSNKTTFLASARRSYLDVLFKLIDVPIRPNYWDFQYKITHTINDKTTLTVLGVGAIDEFTFGVPKKSTPENEYTLRSNPIINQNSYTVGFSLKRLVNHGFVNISISRNTFNNSLDKFEDGKTGDESLRTLKSRSGEIENKLRLDVNKLVNGWKYSYGMMTNYVQFTNNFFSRVRKEITDTNGFVIQPAVDVRFNTSMDFVKLGIFGQVSRYFFDNRLSTSFGLRTDINTFTKKGGHPGETLSPRFSLSYALNEKWNLNASVGRYFKIPIYTILGYKDAGGEFVNKSSRYIQSTHYVTGVEFLPLSSLRFTLESFYKVYKNYPVSVSDGISIANQGIAFGAIGNETTSSTGKGRAYGVELFAQQKLSRNVFFSLSYTIFKSEFSGTSAKYISSSWDNRNLLSAIIGYKLKRAWELGLKFRYAGGSPVTPFDLDASRRNYLSLGTGVSDYSKLNQDRLSPFKQVDIRIDKKWNFKHTTIDLFLDIQNIAKFSPPGAESYTFTRNVDNTGFATTDGNPVQADGSNAIPLILKDNSSIVLPSIGFVVEF